MEKRTRGVFGKRDRVFCQRYGLGRTASMGAGGTGVTYRGCLRTPHLLYAEDDDGEVEAVPGAVAAHPIIPRRQPVRKHLDRNLKWELC